MVEHNHAGTCTACAELLSREKAALEAANRSKDEFLLAYSHELRGRLSVITGWAGVLRARLAGDEECERALETIERNAWAQASLIKEMVERARGQEK